ncbi:kinase-like domain-containing protein [Pavlovales sp. CCMP2436]|nr:kinase-like domain-containing protein [Pavlovales sp. CCMP2436]
MDHEIPGCKTRAVQFDFAMAQFLEGFAVAEFLAFQKLLESVPPSDEAFKHDYKHLSTKPGGSYGAEGAKLFYAIKERIIDNEKDKVEAVKELKALKALSSWRKQSGQAMRHIIGLARDLEETVFKSETHIYFVLDTYPNLQTLDEWQRATYVSGGPVRDLQATVDLMHQLLHAIEMLHTRSIGMAHRDTKPNNILVDYKTRDLWLCDFSIAKNGELITRPGHDLFQAPETLTGESVYTAKCDVWSAGVVWLWMLGGEKLQNGTLNFDAARNLTILARRDAKAYPLHPTIWSLLTKMFHEDPGNRPDARHLSNHPTINPLGGLAASSLPPVRTVVLVLGSTFGELDGELHCESMIKYLCEARIHRLHGGKKDTYLRASELKSNLTTCLEKLLSVEFDVMIYFHLLHGYEMNEGGDVAIRLNEEESFAFGPKLVGLKERVERADGWTAAIGEITILGYL